MKTTITTTVTTTEEKDIELPYYSKTIIGMFHTYFKIDTDEKCQKIDIGENFLIHNNRMFDNSEALKATPCTEADWIEAVEKMEAYTVVVVEREKGNPY